MRCDSFQLELRFRDTSKHSFQEINSEQILQKVLLELGLSGARVSYLSFEVGSKTLNYQFWYGLSYLFAVGPGSMKQCQKHPLPFQRCPASTPNRFHPEWTRS